MNELKTTNSEQLMTTPLKPIEFCVDGMISTGLFILEGAPKVGKSWFTLDMALSIAKGKKCSVGKLSAAQHYTFA